MSLHLFFQLLCLRIQMVFIKQRKLLRLTSWPHYVNSFDCKKLFCFYGRTNQLGKQIRTYLAFVFHCNRKVFYRNENRFLLPGTGQSDLPVRRAKKSGRLRKTFRIRRRHNQRFSGGFGRFGLCPDRPLLNFDRLARGWPRPVVNFI